MIMLNGMGGWVPPPWDQRLCTYINAAEEPSEARTAERVCIYTDYMRSHFGPLGLFLAAHPAPLRSLYWVLFFKGGFTTRQQYELLGVNRTALCNKL